MLALVARFLSAGREGAVRRLRAEAALPVPANANPVARVDFLTDLPDRPRLVDHLAKALQASATRRERRAVIHIGLDRFRQVNECLGHAAGDRVIRAASRRLRDALSDGDFLARIGGDEFVVVTGPVACEDTMRDLADRLVARLAEPIPVEDTDCRIGASVGIAFSDAVADDAARMIVSAETALHEAKRCGRGQVRFFDDRLEAAHINRRNVLNDLRSAVEQQAFVPFYQPQVSLRDGSLVGFEVLARWPHPTRGMLEPDCFLAIAEEAGWLAEIDEIVLRKSLCGLCDFRAAGFRVPRLSVNASSRSLTNSDLVEWLLFLLDAQKLQPCDLAVEVVEETLVTDTDNLAAQNINRLAKRGFTVELDDFGTGYAAIAALASLELSAIKLDRSLIAPLPGVAAGAIVRASVGLCRELGLSVVAEGAETVEQVETLRAMDCDVVQGFGIGRPMPWADAAAWLAAWPGLRGLPRPGGAAADVA